MSEEKAQATDIVKVGHDALRRRAAEVSEPLRRSESFRKLTETMRATLKGRGVGLAAPQVAASLRLFVMEDPQEACDRDPEKAKKGREPFPFTLVINPTWRPASDDKAEFLEGCLSIPGLQAKVSRYETIEGEWQDLEGHRHREIMQGWKARIFQHEHDHLDGVLAIDHLDPRPKIDYEDVGRGIDESLLADLARSS